MYFRTAFVEMIGVRCRCVAVYSFVTAVRNETARLVSAVSNGRLVTLIGVFAFPFWKC